MKYSILLILLAFNSAYADVCLEGPDQALEYRSQKTAEPMVMQAGAFEVPVAVHGEQTLYDSFERQAHQRINLSIGIPTRRFNAIKLSCIDSNPAIREALRSSRVYSDRLDPISLKIDQLPTALNEFFKDRNPELLNRTKVEVIVTEQSILNQVADTDEIYYNSIDKWAEDKNHISLLGKRFTANLREEFLNPSNPGSININMDNQYDLMCDFLTGNARFRITLETEAPSNRLAIDSQSPDVVMIAHVDKVLDGLKSRLNIADSQMSLSKKAYFEAGAAWKDLVEQREVWSLEDSTKAFNVVEGLFDTGLDAASERETRCLAENNSEITSETAIHSFDLNVTSLEAWTIGNSKEESE